MFSNAGPDGFLSIEHSSIFYRSVQVIGFALLQGYILVMQKSFTWSVYTDDYKGRPQIRQDYPLNLSISLSGGKETNKDSPSNGE